MTAHRFRFLGTKAADGRWELAEGEADHALKVLRLGDGTEAEITDGQGAWAVGTLRAAGKKGLTFEAAREAREPRPATGLVVALGALKPGDVDEVIPALVELGVDRIVVFGQSGVAKARLAERATERWLRIRLQAIKQCKRAWIPPIDVVDGVEGVVEAAGEAPATRVMLAAGADQTLPELLTARAGRGQDVWLVVGGERGLDAAETERLAAGGFRAAAIGPFVLRAVTAVVAAAAVAAADRMAAACR